MEETKDVPELSSIKPQSKPILSEQEVKIFENCLRNNSENTSALECVLTSVMDGVYYIDGTLTSEECRLLRDVIDNSSSLSFWCHDKEKDEDVKSFRNAFTIEMHSELFCQIIWERIRHLFLDFRISINDDPNDKDYERDLIGDWLPIGLNPDSLFARYPSGGSFAPHTDGRAILDFNTRSHYSIVLFLNSVPNDSGAGTRIYEDSAVKHLKKRRESLD